MLNCVSVRNMRNSDRQTIEGGVSGKELIRRAAQAVYALVAWQGSVAVITGSGNNGADGFALAAILHNNGVDVTVYKVSEHLHDDCFYFAGKAKNAGVPIHNYQGGKALLSQYHMIVDCMLGTGFSGEVRESYRTAIEEINGCDGYVVSVDINSGMNGDTGEGSIVVRSDLTVAIQFVKIGMVQKTAEKYIGRLVCADIGMILAEPEHLICNQNEWEALHERLDISQHDCVAEHNGTRYFRCPQWLEASDSSTEKI